MYRRDDISGNAFVAPLYCDGFTQWADSQTVRRDIDVNDMKFDTQSDDTQPESEGQKHEVLGDMDVNDLIQDYTVDARVDDGVDPEAPWILRCDPWRKAIADKQADLKPDDMTNMKPDNEPKAEPADKPSPRPTAAKSKPRSIARPLASSSSSTRHCSICTCSKPSTVTEQH